MDVPEDIEGSWYKGQIFFIIKDRVFQPSSPVRHACELQHLLVFNYSVVPPILFLYTDGGPDHRVVYFSALIALFLTLDLDYLCAVRTAPYNSWRNPVERMMSILNLGLQCIGIMRAEMDSSFEHEAEKCKNMAQLRKNAEKDPAFIAAVSDSLSPVKVLLTNTFMRLRHGDEMIKCFSSATTQELDDFWTAVIAIDSSILCPSSGCKYNKSVLSKSTVLQHFMSHCCRIRHYSFQIMKCGEASCAVCRLPRDLFTTMHFLPDPVPGNDEHYLPFSDIFGKSTTDEHRPSLKKQKSSIPFTPTAQHARNANTMLQCDECSKWRLVYAKHKLKKEQYEKLQDELEDASFSCGSQLSELLGEKHAELPVYVKDLTCEDLIEKLYYTVGHEPICIYCSDLVSDYNKSSVHYPLCTFCNTKQSIKKYGK